MGAGRRLDPVGEGECEVERTDGARAPTWRSMEPLSLVGLGHVILLSSGVGSRCLGLGPRGAGKEVQVPRPATSVAGSWVVLITSSSQYI